MVIDSYAIFWSTTMFSGDFVFDIHRADLYQTQPSCLYENILRKQVQWATLQ